jgi:hypothetical protein
MCIHCDEVFTRSHYKPHDPNACPLRASQYCFHCSDYGHLTVACPTPPSLKAYYGFAKPVATAPEPEPAAAVSGRANLREQLKQRGKAAAAAAANKPEELVIEMLENTEVIAAFLRARGVQPATKLTENKSRLATWAKTVAVEINYIPEEWEPQGYSNTDY